MKIGIGIDTGGTYTDAVIYDFETRNILGSSKALTTKEDLSEGIGLVLDSLSGDLLKKAEIVSLSTTLATNACVENKGGRAKLLFIGVDKEIVAKAGTQYGLPDVKDIYFLDGGSSMNGEIIKTPDWDIFMKESEAFLQSADAVGVVEIYSMKNNATLEKKAKELIEAKYNIPVICGHELFSDLNSVQRGSSTLLNARLIPIIANFLASIKKALEQRDVNAPIVIVRSDGSLMSEQFTGFRPVETLLCGPAASVAGGIALTNEKNSLIIDMGGTTTDIAIVKEGIPVQAKDGINVGKWRTFVKGVYIDTFGLGGDSTIRFNNFGNLVLEPSRIIPLSIAAHTWPCMTERLQKLFDKTKEHILPLHEFFSLVKDISDHPRYTKEEKDFCSLLKNGPLIFSDAAAAMRTDVYNLNVKRLEREGIVMRCGLTPTDIMHIKGDFNHYNSEAARLGAAFVSSCMGIDIDFLANQVYDQVKKTLYFNVVRMLLEDSYPQLKKKGLDQGIETLIYASWEMANSTESHNFLELHFNTPASLVGIGAPIHIFLPDVAKALGTKCIIPENADVANALGAVIGNISASCEIEVKPEYSPAGIGGYTVYGKSQNFFEEDEEKAIHIALEEATAEAHTEAMRRGATGELTVTSQVSKSSSKIKGGNDILLSIKVIATAVGRVSI